MYRRRWAATTLVLVMLPLAGGCDQEAPGYERLGVRADDSGVVVRYVVCEGESVQEARLVLLDGDTIAGDDGDQLIWRIGSDDPAVAEMLADGTLIAQGTERMTLDPDENYFLEVETTANLVDTNGFNTSDLSSTEWFVHQRLEGEEDFDANAAESCD